MDGSKANGVPYLKCHHDWQRPLNPTGRHWEPEHPLAITVSPAREAGKCSL